MISNPEHLITCCPALGLCLTYPLDYARTRLSSDIGSGKKREFAGLLDCLKKSVASQGIRGPYKGAVISVTGCFIYRGFYFGMYDILKSYIPANARNQYV